MVEDEDLQDIMAEINGTLDDDYTDNEQMVTYEIGEETAKLIMDDIRSLVTDDADLLSDITMGGKWSIDDLNTFIVGLGGVSVTLLEPDDGSDIPKLGVAHTCPMAETPTNNLLKGMLKILRAQEELNEYEIKWSDVIAVEINSHSVALEYSGEPLNFDQGD